MKTFRLTALLIFVAFLHTQAGHAQAKTASVTITIADKYGKKLPDDFVLNKEDLVLAIGDTPVEITKITAYKDAPRRIGILLDASNSTSADFNGNKAIVLILANTVFRPEKDIVFLGAFDTSVGLSKFTTKRSDISESLKLVRPGGGTALFDAISAAIKGRTLPAKAVNPEALDYLFLISDGDDNQSNTTREEATQKAIASGVAISCITLPRLGGFQDKGTNVMEALAAQTGGVQVNELDEKRLQMRLFSVSDEMQQRYRIEFSYEARPKPKQLKIRLSGDEKALILRYPQGLRF